MWNQEAESECDFLMIHTVYAVAADLSVYIFGGGCAVRGSRCFWVTDPEATNFDPLATIDDRSCFFPSGLADELIGTWKLAPFAGMK